MEPSTAHNIVQAIQLSVAPVFLIAGIGTLLNVLTSRLARVVDRGRALERDLSLDVEKEARVLAELKLLDRRMNWIHHAITLSTFAILLVCLLIVTLFIDEFIAVDLSRFVAILFVATMASLIAGLVAFLCEISYARRVLRISAHLLMSGPPRS